MARSSDSRVVPTTRQTLMLGAWFGLVTGIGAVGLWAIKAFVLDRVTLITPHVVWTSPVTFLLLGLVAASALALAARALPRLFPLHVMVFLFTALGCVCGLLIWSTELQDLAVGLLALGIAVQVAAFARARPEVALRLTRRTLPALAVLVAAMALGLVGGTWAIERRAIARLPAAAAGDSSPDVLFIILDTVRAANLSLYGYARPTTPNLSRLASRAVTFDLAIAGSPWTLPSHAVMFTGRQAHELSTDWEVGLDASAPTIAEHLQSHGYLTGGFAGNFFYGNSEWGINRGFVHYEDYVPSLGHAMLSTFPGHWLVKRMEAARLDRRFWFHLLNGRRIAPDVNRSLVRWLDGVRDAGRPYFAFVNYYDAHDPYVAPDSLIDRMKAMRPGDSVPVRRGTANGLVDADAMARQRALDQIDRHDSAIAYLDAQVGALLADLTARGLLDNTIVIIASDHGEEFGESGHHWHGESVRMPSLHVPLMILAPGRAPAGVRVAEPVSLRDLPATIVNLTATSAGAPFPGRSLARYWTTPEASEAEPLLSSVKLRTPRKQTGDSTVYSIVVPGEGGGGGMHFIRTDRGAEFLFSLADDPFEQIDLRQRDVNRLAVYRTTLQRLLRANGQPVRPIGGGTHE